jgi:Ca2+-binding RTX toxin-like protein
VDLSKNRVTYSVASIGTKTLTVKNFSNVIGSPGNDKIKVNGVNGLIAGGDGDDVIIGGGGGYLIYGNGNSRSLPPNEKNTIDYSDLGTSLSLRVLGEYDNDDRRLFVDKSSGRDQINQFQKIIGARNQTNTIDAHTDDGSTNQTRIDVNLAENSLKRISLFAPNPVQQFEVVNFVNFVGSKQNDTIVGANKNGKLTGGGGNDTITGGNKNDIITGSDSTARGVGEVDTLTGGGGRDKFVLGDEKGAYYVGKGANDYALITDFNLFKDSISIGSLKDYSFALEGTNTIDLYSGKDVNTRDLIAKIQIAGGISSVAGNAKSVMGAEASLNAIVCKLDIVSAA